MGKKTPKKGVIVLCGICAALYWLTVVINLIGQYYQDSPLSFCLNVLCAVIWSLAFFRMRRNSLKDKDE